MHVSKRSMPVHWATQRINRLVGTRRSEIRIGINLKSGPRCLQEQALTER